MAETPLLNPETLALARLESCLADAMKRETSSQHRLAERSGVVAKILNRTVTLAEYVLFVRNLLPIYQAFERPMEHTKATARLAPFLDTRLDRSESLIQDLDNIIGRDAWLDLPLMPSAKKYSHLIQQMKKAESIDLLGHIYVRYLGDLNGGQVLRRILADSFNLNACCLKFYCFPAISDLKNFRVEYRRQLNAFEVDTSEKSAIVGAAVRGFQLNINVSNEIVAQHRRSLATPF